MNTIMNSQRVTSLNSAVVKRLDFLILTRSNLDWNSH